jgi:uncharacterized protein
MMIRSLSLAMLLATAACASAPDIRYYTLSPVPSLPGAKNARAIAPGTVFALDTVNVPELLDRPQIVLRSGANTVSMLDDDRWAAPLPDQLRRVLAADLAARLGADAVVDPGLDPAPRATRRIAVSILEFDPRRDGPSAISASWVVSEGTSPLRRSIVTSDRARHVGQPAGYGVAEDVATMSDLLAKVADDIAATVVAAQ